jgi:hypothetical protein
VVVKVLWIIEDERRRRERSIQDFVEVYVWRRNKDGKVERKDGILVNAAKNVVTTAGHAPLATRQPMRGRLFDVHRCIMQVILIRSIGSNEVVEVQLCLSMTSCNALYWVSVACG